MKTMNHPLPEDFRTDPEVMQGESLATSECG
jgi:hypothetical protein